MDYCVSTFVSTHSAILAQKLLDGVCPFQVMPVLRCISAGCGISLRFRPDDLGAVGVAFAARLPSEEYAFYGISGTGSNLIATALV